MDWERVAQALSGPELVKLVLASILIVAFVFWQRKEAEGVMRGYVVVAGFALARDILFLLVPQPELYRASDLLLLALVALAFGLPLGGGALLYAAVAFAGLAGLLALILGYLHSTMIPPGFFLVAGLAPVAILFLYGSEKSDLAEGQTRRLIRKVRYPLALASFAYLVAESILGPGDFWFQSAAVSIYYAAISLVGFVFVDVLRDELISAVEYYEESVDSLFELLSATGSVIKVGFSLQEVLDGMVGIMVSKTGADGGIVLLAEEGEEVVAVRALQGNFPPPFKLPDSLPKDEERVTAHVRHARFKIGEGFFGELARDGSALLSTDASADPRIFRNGDEEWLRLRSLMVAPLIARDRIIGLLAVSRVGPEPFGERDFDRLKLIASFGALSVSEAFTFLEAADRSDIDREAAIAL
ncbi:MAG: GAF domain-containing protein, partial [Spirochaetota bacterium]